MKQIPCDDCGLPYTKCKCDLKKDLNVQKVIQKVLKKYEKNEKVNMVRIKSISHLTTLMAGSTEGHCTYDPKMKRWIPGKFTPSPKGIFDWENLNGSGKGKTEFILDSGSQLNLIPMKNIRKQGVDIESLPQINLNVTGVGGEMSAIWYKLRVKVTSRLTNQSHFEEFYTSSACKATLLSYATLIRLGHIDPTTFESFQKNKEQMKNPQRLYMSQNVKNRPFMIKTQWNSSVIAQEENLIQMKNKKKKEKPMKRN